MDEIVYSSAASLAHAIRTGKISSEEVIDAHLQRIEEVNPGLNAIVQLTADAARKEAQEADSALARGDIKGPLHGVPFTVKDNIDTAGVISTAGTKGRASFIPGKDATVVARMRAAGAILLGKTNLPELGLAYETDNLVYGRTVNPYDPSRTPGGSSGGEAAIIAAGGSPLGLGNDIGGSIRIPAHFCGIAGIKPTVGRVPITGNFPFPAGMLGPLVQIGPMARFVEDLVLSLRIISGMDWRDPAVVPVLLGNPDAIKLNSLSAAFYTDNGIISPTHETIEVIGKAAQVLADAGMAVKEARPAGVEQSLELFRALFRADGGAGIEARLSRAGTTETQIHPWTKASLERSRSSAKSIAEFSSLVFRWDLFCSTMLSFMKDYDVIICPVCAYPAMLHGTTFDKDKYPAFSYSVTYNLTGWPAAVVRGGTSPEGLPIGVQIVARPWREDVALAVAQHIEKTLGVAAPFALIII